MLYGTKPFLISKFLFESISMLVRESKTVTFAPASDNSLAVS